MEVLAKCSCCSQLNPCRQPWQSCVLKGPTALLCSDSEWDEWLEDEEDLQLSTREQTTLSFSVSLLCFGSPGRRGEGVSITFTQSRVHLPTSGIDRHVAPARGHRCVNPDAGARHGDAGHYKTLVLGVGADEEVESNRGSTHLPREAAKNKDSSH